MWTWKGGENSTTIIACPFHNLPVRQEVNLYVEQARSKKEAIQIPVMNQLASTFPTCCCWTVGVPHECLRCPRGLAPALETQDACQKLPYPSSSMCFQHKIQASRRWSCRLELLHGQSLCSHIDSESQCLGALSQPWQSRSIRKDFPCCFTVPPCQYSNKPGCNGWNKLSCLCLLKGGKRYELQAGRSPSNLISFSKSCLLFGRKFTAIFILTLFIFLSIFSTLLTA